MDWRERSRHRTDRSRGAGPECPQLWSSQAPPLLGLSAWRSALRENCCRTRAEVERPLCDPRVIGFHRGVANATANLSPFRPLTMVALEHDGRLLIKGEHARYVCGTDARSPTPNRARSLNRLCWLFKTAG